MVPTVARALAVLLAFALSACASTPSVSAPASVELDFADPPLAMDTVDCDALLSEVEVETILETDVAPVGRRASSCYWTASGGVVQLVFNTSEQFGQWRDTLQGTYTRPIDVGGVDVRAEPGSESVAGFGPDRGAIVHGVHAEGRAVQLLLLALSRL